MKMSSHLLKTTITCDLQSLDKKPSEGSMSLIRQPTMSNSNNPL